MRLYLLQSSWNSPSLVFAANKEGLWKDASAAKHSIHQCYSWRQHTYFCVMDNKGQLLISWHRYIWAPVKACWRLQFPWTATLCVVIWPTLAEAWTAHACEDHYICHGHQCHQWTLTWSGSGNGVRQLLSNEPPPEAGEWSAKFDASSKSLLPRLLLIPDSNIQSCTMFTTFSTRVQLLCNSFLFK